MRDRAYLTQLVCSVEHFLRTSLARVAVKGDNKRLRYAAVALLLLESLLALTGGL